MAGIYGEFGGPVDGEVVGRVSGVLDPLGTDRVETLAGPGGLLAAFVFRGLPAAVRRTFDDGRYAGVLGGDVAAVGQVPWERMVDSVRRGSPQDFPELGGFFALALHDRETGRAWVVTDPYCFYPVFYRLAGGRAWVASHQGAFAASGPPLELDPAWLWELLYYSFPLGPTGLYRGVRRAPPATVTEIEPASGVVVHHRYGRVYRQAERPLTGGEALEHAVAVFRGVMPRYYGYPGGVAHALTGGWDCRTLAGLVPDGDTDRVLAYTYGRAGSNDLLESRRIARGLGLEHMEILFDAPYIERIPLLAREAVFQAGGLENINRAYVPRTYDLVTSGGTRFPYVISGIGADAIFRGHVPTPNGLSYDMDAAYRTGKRTIDEEFFRGVFGERYGLFREYIDGALDWFEKTYGGFGSVQSYFDYEIYEGLPRYFNGECAIADHFSSFRVPYLDPEVTQLACDIEYSVMKLWRFINDDVYKETFVQSALIESSPRLRRVSINGIPVRAFSCRNETLYKLMRIAHKGPRKLISLARRERKPLLEDWDTWYRTVLSPTFDELLGPGARVRRYLDGAWIDRIRDDRTLHWLKLVTTAEITLRLAENGWKRFWERPLGVHAR